MIFCFWVQKKRYLDWDKYLKKTVFEFFSSISWGLCTGTKCEKVVLMGFSTGTRSEKFNFYSSNIQNSLLAPVLNPKSTTFSQIRGLPEMYFQSQNYS